jgi:hypothetical protein
MIIEQFSPVFIGYSDNEKHFEIKNELLEECKKLKNLIKSGGNNWISHKTYNTSYTYNLKKNKKFKKLNEWVLSKVHEYGKNLNFKHNKFKIDTAWFNYDNQYDFQEYHNHHTSNLSAIYFLESNPKTCAKVFFNANFNKSPNDPESTDKYVNGYSAIYDSIPGRLLIFNSSLNHCASFHGPC